MWAPHSLYRLPINVSLILVSKKPPPHLVFPHPESHTHTHTSCIFYMYNCSWLLWSCISVQWDKNLKPISEPRGKFTHRCIFISGLLRPCQGNIFSSNSAFFIPRKYFSFSIVKPFSFNLCIKISIAWQSSLLSWKASWKKKKMFKLQLKNWDPAFYSWP